MTNILTKFEALKESAFIDIWDNKTGNDRAPFCKFVLTDKTTKERFVAPVWRKKDGKLFLGDFEASETKPASPAVDYKTTREVSGADIHDDFGDSPPF